MHRLAAVCLVLLSTTVPPALGATGDVTEFSAGITALGQLRSIAAGPDGNLWFTEQAGRIGRITLAGVISEYATGITGGNP